MKLHKFFSLKRFGRLLAADLRLNSKRYLYFFAGAAVGIYLLFLFGMLRFFDQRFTVESSYYYSMFILSLVALGAYIGSAFPAFSEKPTTASYLLFPASHFEKLLSQFLLYFVAGTIIFTFLFWVDAHLARLSLLNLESVRTGKWVIEPFSYSMILNPSPYPHSKKNILEYGLQWIMMFSVISFLFTARLFFNKFALAKSIISGIVIAISISCLMVLCSHLFFPEKTQGFEIALVSYHSDFFNTDTGVLFIYSLCLIVCLFFLPLAYFKLKEKQL